MANKIWLAVCSAVLALLLSGCGGGDETYVTNNYPAETPAVVVGEVVDDNVTLVVVSDPITVNAGISYEVTAQVTCTVDVNGLCPKPAVVKDISSSVGTLIGVSYERSGTWQYIHQLNEGEVFIPEASLVLDRPDRLTFYYSTTPAAMLGAVPLKLGVSTTYGQVKVVGVPLVNIANGPVEIIAVTANNFGTGIGTNREVATVTLVCPSQVTCRVLQPFTTRWQSTTDTKLAQVAVSYNYKGGGDDYSNQVEVSQGTWTWLDFSWGEEFTFTGELRVSISTTLPSGLVEVVPSSIVVVDDFGRPLYVNTGGHAIFGGQKG